jgi:hypothetical protein
MDRTALKAFLRWYGRRTAYLNAVARGLGRIDLTGAVVTTTIPDVLRKLARVEVQRRQANRAVQTATTAATATSPTPTPDSIPYPLEDLYAMAVDAKLEVTLKFTTVPNAKPAGQGKMAFALKTPDGQYVTAEVSTKAWNKLSKAAQDWPAWTAALSGTMGARTEKGFTLANPGLQVFERKPKVPGETADSQVEASAAAPTPMAPATPTPAPADPIQPASVPPTPDTPTPSPASRKAVLSLKNRQANS